MALRLFIILFVCTFSLKAQCDYTNIGYDRDSKALYLKSMPITLELYETPFNGRLIQVFLVRNGNSYYLEFEITRDSASQDLQPVCFVKGDRVSFSLSNNTYISLSQIEDKICGVKFENSTNGFVTVTNYINVILTQDSFEKLLKNEVLLMKISSENYNKTFVLKNEMEELINNQMTITNPTRFFMDNIECLTNPKL